MSKSCLGGHTQGWVSSIGATLCLLALIAFTLVPNVTYANYCNHVNITNDYPGQVNPGDSVQIVTTIALNCNSGPSSYEGNVAIVDSHGFRLTATRFFVSQVTFNEDVTAQVNDWVVAPQISVNWQLHATVDLYLPTAGGVLWNSVYSNSSGPMEIRVGSPPISTNTTTTTSSQTSTESSTTQSFVTKTLTTTVSATLSLAPSLTSRVQTLTSKSSSAILPRQQFYADMRLWFVAVFLIALAIILRLRAVTH